MLPDLDALIDAEILNDYYGRWDDDERETSTRSHVWWSYELKTRLCHRCKDRVIEHLANRGTCIPCLDELAAIHERGENEERQDLISERFATRSEQAA